MTIDGALRLLATPREDAPEPQPREHPLTGVGRNLDEAMSIVQAEAAAINARLDRAEEHPGSVPLKELLATRERAKELLGYVDQISPLVDEYGALVAEASTS